MDTIEFVRRSKLIHGDFYDYSKTIYVKSSLKVIITCPRHGDFEQTPANHLRFKCKKCNNNKFADDFIEKANKVHKNKYKYDKVKYVNSYTKVTITCPKHGDFEQAPHGHLDGNGCTKCIYINKRMEYVTNLEQFIEQANKIHDFVYEYNKSTYINNHTKLIITCPRHGDFIQKPNDHLCGSGCSKCGNEKKRVKKSDTKERFIEKAIKAHGNRYNYDKVIYVNNHTKIIINCSVHGDFEQLPSNHKNGSNCPACVNCARHTTESFVAKANIVHDNKYKYDKTTYNGNREKLIITCKTHGDFEQAAHSHLSGRCCPSCNDSKGEAAIAEILDMFNFKYERQKKYIDCKNIRSLPFDFFLPEFDLLIEFDGEQHFRPIAAWGGQEKFEKTVANDKIKTEYCAINGKKLLRIRYDEDIFDKLIDVLM